MKSNLLFKLLTIACLAMVVGCVLSGDPILSIAGPCAAIGTYAVGDVTLRSTLSLPNGAATTTSTAIDLGHGSNGGNFTDNEFLLEVPAVNATQLPNTQTLTYSVVSSASSDLSSPTVHNAAQLVQTGAGGAGAAAAQVRLRLPSDCKRYVGIKCVKSGAGDASAATATLRMLF